MKNKYKTLKSNTFRMMPPNYFLFLKMYIQIFYLIFLSTCDFKLLYFFIIFQLHLHHLYLV